MKVKRESEVAQSCLTLHNLPGSSLHGIFQARVLEWIAIAFSVLHVKRLQIKMRHSLGGKTRNRILFVTILSKDREFSGGRREVYIHWDQNDFSLKGVGGISLVIQRLRLCTSNVGGMSSIPGWDQRSHMSLS